MMRTSSQWCSMAALVASALAMGALTTACQQSQAAPDPAADQGSAPAAEATPRKETANYLVELKPATSYEVGKDATFAVEIQSRGAYKLNDEYPHKFKVKEAEGIEFKKTTLKAADGRFEKNSGAFTVDLKPTKAGHPEVGGTLIVGLCSADNCIIEKIPLVAKIDIK